MVNHKTLKCIYIVHICTTTFEQKKKKDKTKRMKWNFEIILTTTLMTKDSRSIFQSDYSLLYDLTKQKIVLSTRSILSIYEKIIVENIMILEF